LVRVIHRLGFLDINIVITCKDSIGDIPAGQEGCLAYPQRYLETVGPGLRWIRCTRSTS
jgi:hypothetical protein